MRETRPLAREEERRDLFLFPLLACGITWLTNLPWMLACVRGLAPPPHALPLVALGAFGPTLAALMLAMRRGAVRQVFTPFRAPLRWIAIAVVVSPLLHLPATLLEVVLGGEPAQWFYPPVEPERIAALFLFSFGEEFGWRGFGYPRAVEQFGIVRGNLLLGCVWGLWHFGMAFTPEQGAPSASTLLFLMAQLALASVIWAWVFERAGRGMSVAVALHMGAHLDNVSRAPASETRLEVLRFAVLCAAAALAAYALVRRRPPLPNTQLDVADPSRTVDR